MNSSIELGDFLRSRRARMRPEAFGLANGRRRRTPGLRREEVAERAGISTDWYVRLEQGRTVSPSHTTVEALARALDLDTQEHAHLRALAGQTPTRHIEQEKVPPILRKIVAGCFTQPMSPARVGTCWRGTMPPASCFATSARCPRRSATSCCLCSPIRAHERCSAAVGQIPRAPCWRSFAP